MFLTDENRLAILDWSLVGTLTEPERIAIVQIMQGAITHAPRIVEVLESLCDRPAANQPALTTVVHTGLKQIRQGKLPGLSWLVGMLDDGVHTARLRFRTDLMLFRKSLHTLEGVIAELGAEASASGAALLVDFVRHFWREWPGTGSPIRTRADLPRGCPTPTSQNLCSAHPSRWLAFG